MSNKDKGKHNKVALRLFCQDNILVLIVRLLTDLEFINQSEINQPYNNDLL